MVIVQVSFFDSNKKYINQLFSVSPFPKVTRIKYRLLVQRLDVTLMRLIAQIKGVADSIIVAKMAHKIG